MQHERQFYIDGQWVDPHSTQTADVVNPANEEVVGTIILGDQVDVDAAVAAAREAFTHFAQTTVDERAALLERIIDVYTKRIPSLLQSSRRKWGHRCRLRRRRRHRRGCDTSRRASLPCGTSHGKQTWGAITSYMSRSACVR